MKTRTPLFLLPLLITVVSISSAETPNLSEKEIRHQLIMGSTEDSFPYLPKEFFKSGNREKLILVVSSVLKENSVRTTLQSYGKSSLEGDEPFQYWSVFRALTLAGYLEIPDAEELIRPYTRFSDRSLRTEALDALAAVGSNEVVEILYEAFKYYEQKLPQSIDEESGPWGSSAWNSLESLATIGGPTADQFLGQGLKLWATHIQKPSNQEALESQEILDIETARKSIRSKQDTLARITK